MIWTWVILGIVAVFILGWLVMYQQSQWLLLALFGLVGFIIFMWLR